MNEPTTETVADDWQHREGHRPEAGPNLRYLLGHITVSILLAVAAAIAAWLVLRPTGQPANPGGTVPNHSALRGHGFRSLPAPPGHDEIVQRSAGGSSPRSGRILGAAASERSRPTRPSGLGQPSQISAGAALPTAAGRYQP
jgi:hypothetical protein